MMKWKAILAGAIAVAASAAMVHAQDTGSASDSRLVRGEEVFTYWCATCHSAGPGMPGTQALQAKYNGSVPAVLTERTDLTPELIAFYVRNGISVMPFFRKTEVSDADLATLSEFIVARSSSE